MTDSNNYIVFPNIDGDHVFPPEVRAAIAEMPEMEAKYAPISGSVEYIDPVEAAALLGSKLDAAQKGQALGVAGLDSGAKLLETNIPDRLSVASQNATYATKDSPTFTGTVSGVTKTHVGLGNVNNTADADKPVSTAQQAALDAKAPTVSPTFTGIVGGISKSMVGLPNVNNTADVDKPVSTAQQDALNLKAPLASPVFTGTVGGISKSMVGLANVNNTADIDKPVSTATQSAIDATVSPTTLVEGIPLYVYGNSYTVAPAVGRATTEWPKRLQSRLDMGALASNGHSGAVMGQIAYNLNNNVDGATPSRKWTTGSKGLVIVEESINDTVTFGTSAKAQTAYGMALRTMVELMRATIRKDATDVAITYTGTWSTGTTYLVNSGKKTSAVGAKASFSVTGDAVTLYWMGDKDATAYATPDVKIGRTVIGTIDTRNQMDPYNAPGTVGTGIGVNLCCTRITGMGAGAHTVDVILTASVTNPLYFDGFSVPGTKPPQIIFLKEGLISNYNPNGSSAARDAYNSIMDTVAAEYPSFVSVADPGASWDASCLYMGDGTGNHPNDKGYTVQTDTLAAKIKTLGYRDGMHIL
jgi:hypothetical protein